MSGKIYKTLIGEIAEWMTAAQEHRQQAISKLLQSSPNMTVPPAATQKSILDAGKSQNTDVSKSVTEDDAVTDRLAKVHEQIRVVVDRNYQNLETEQADQRKLRDASEILIYLRSQRTYKALLERYNPTATMADDERVRLTARRVGLEVPKDIEHRLATEEEALVDKEKSDSESDKSK
ncbi:uncharacterized protein V1516DRAFT_692869 [Lipomyces oligophaga]|uniref:uncharacterized protein n=1 Tax=Lipomyces oligophaga TaxID=45792 RepID=UPI0034CEE32D